MATEFLQRKYHTLKTDAEKDALIDWLTQRLAASEREIAKLRALYIERPEARERCENRPTA
jgi:hypothetical protein